MNLLVNSKTLSSHNFDELKAFKDELSFINKLSYVGISALSRNEINTDEFVSYMNFLSDTTFQKIEDFKVLLSCIDKEHDVLG